jgi:hypothetical protein
VSAAKKARYSFMSCGYDEVECAKCATPATGYWKLSYWGLCSRCHRVEFEAQEAGRKIFQAAKRKGQFGKVTDYSCVDCGKRAQVWEHRDYRKPLEVEPCCYSCNQKRGPAKFGVFYPPPTEVVEAPDCAALTLMVAA